MASATPTPANTPLTCSPVSPPWLPMYVTKNTGEYTDTHAAARLAAGLTEDKTETAPLDLMLPPLALTRQRNLESAVRSLRLDTVHPKPYL